MKLPLAIMTSDDTHDAIAAMLEATGRYGLDREQAVLLHVEVVLAES